MRKRMKKKATNRKRAIKSMESAIVGRVKG